MGSLHQPAHPLTAAVFGHTIKGTLQMLAPVGRIHIGYLCADVGTGW